MSAFKQLDEFTQKLRDINESTRVFVTVSNIVGAFVLIYCCCKSSVTLFNGFRLYVLSQSSKTDYRKRYGQWVVITGATDGIGLEFAKELARRGHSIIVIGRNDVKLAKTRLLLKGQPNVGEVETIKIDLADSSLENYERIKPQIDSEKRDIGILINNAGVAFLPTIFSNVEMEQLQAYVNVNISATVYISRMILPGMVARGRGLLVNVSSIFGSNQSPFTGLYAPAKHFMNCFSRQLNIEYAKYPVDIINLTPSYIRTRMVTDHSRVSTPACFFPSPELYAKSALNACSTRIPEFYGLLHHALSFGLLKILGLWPLVHWICMKFLMRYGKLSPSPMRKSQ